MFDEDDFRGSAKGGVRNDYRRLGVEMRARASGGAETKPEVVFKVIGHIKSSMGVGAAINYISNDREESDREATDIDPLRPLEHPDIGKLPVWNEVGARLEGDQIKNELKSWGLIDDKDNLSNKAKKLDRKERGDLPNKERYKSRQGTHVIFSLPKHIGSNRQREVTAAVGNTLSKTFGQQAHRYVYTTHSHNGRVHVHAIIKSKSESTGPENRPRQLRINRQDIDGIRSRFAKELNRRGFGVSATRRIDRPRMRDQIAKGREPLHRNQKMVKFVKGAGDKRAFVGAKPAYNVKWLSDLEKRAPRWHQSHALEYVNRATGATHTVTAHQTVQHGNMKQRMEQNKESPLVRDMLKTFKSPESAAVSLADLSREDSRLAAWSLKNRPEVFGEVKDPKGIQLKPADLKTGLADLRSWVTREPELTEQKKGAVLTAVRKQSVELDGLKAQRAREHDLKAAGGVQAKLIKEYEKQPGHDKAIVAELRDKGPLQKIKDQQEWQRPHQQAGEQSKVAEQQGRGPSQTPDQALQEKLEKARKQFENTSQASQRDKGRGRER